MLRISISGASAADGTVKLEGKLLGPWVEEVRHHFMAVDRGLLPRLDLSCVTFVDRDGTELLRQLLRQGIQIESCSAFVAELLRSDCKRIN
jgi:hypothetical protein